MTAMPSPHIPQLAEYLHVISQLSLSPFLTVPMPDLEGERGGVDWTCDSAPQGHTVGALEGRFLGV